MKKQLTITRLNDSGENETEKWLWLELEYNGDTRFLRFDFDKETELWNLGADDYFRNEADDVDLDLDLDEVWNTYGFTKTICF